MICALVLSICFTSASAATYENFAHASVVNVVNARKTTWTAGYNAYFAGQDWREIKLRLGAILDSPKIIRRYLAKSVTLPPVNLPENFDVRDRWPVCRNRISQIRDQGRCGSCWAVAAASVATDRSCIQSNGTIDVDLSAEDVLACCGTQCGSCSGGLTTLAMNYWWKTGIVTGGNYGDKSTCYPYSIAPTDPSPKTPKCGRIVSPRRRICIRIFWWRFCFWLPDIFAKVCQPGYPIPFAQDKHKAVSAYSITGGEVAMMRDIYARGPLAASYIVFDDFPYYTSGVYQRVSTSKSIGAHAVTIIGWGVENSTKYWLVKNSWNTTWGDEGYFKILRGSNHCDIESRRVAAGNLLAKF